MKVLSGLLLVLALAYIAVNFMGLPPQLIAENLVYAACYAAIALLLLRQASRGLLAVLLFIASFNAGRVSETVWSPTIGLGPLALEHAPLLLYLLLIIALAIAALNKNLPR